MELIYSICYYYGKNKFKNILNHINSYKNIDCEKKFIVFITIDSFDKEYHNKVKNEIINKIKLILDISEVIILTDYNWGGTIQALYEIYLYLEHLYSKKIYIAHFEEDFIPINNKWYIDSKTLLEKNNYIYIGEHCPSKKEFKNNIKVAVKIDFIKIINKYNNKTYENKCYWTDGGFYFSSINNFEIIKNKIGTFHKGNKNEKYNHYIDGIVLGEVGFPTLLHYNNLKFTGLYRSNYFIHCE